MATALRAFLMVRSLEGGWSVSVHSEMDDLLKWWSSYAHVNGKTAVVHVGFSRPASHEFDSLASEFRDRVLLTASARYSLPAGFLCSSNSVGSAANLPIFLAMRGWGYEI